MALDSWIRTRLDKPTREALEAIAKRERRKLSEVARFALEEYAAKHRPTTKAAPPKKASAPRREAPKSQDQDPRDRPSQN